MNRLSKNLFDQSPRIYKLNELEYHPDLFSERSALFFTPTSEIPKKYIGEGRLDVFLRASLPSWLEYFEIYSLRSPKIWVDLLQRATGKIRWRPLSTRAYISFENFDSYGRGTDLLIKPALDSLKVSTTGRRDGKRLYYFGAIVDDDRDHIAKIDVTEVIEVTPVKARCRVIVEPADSKADGSMTYRTNWPDETA